MKTATSLALTAAALLALGLNLATAAESLKVGDTAPLVTSTDQNGKEWKLAGLIGKKIVLLYFYPKDDTPGCTKEACSFRDQIEDLKSANVEVVGVSFDSAESHLKFIDKHKLNFPLLADTDGKVADAYGARREPSKAMSRRISFLIGLDGKIVAITDNSSADVHISEMKEAIGKLKKQ
jgi:thioredoxin-dependent peroxiredoxin